MSAFAAATAVRRRGDGAPDDRGVVESWYDAELDAGWSVGGRPNGGYLLAVMANAALDAADRPHALATSGHFLRSPTGGPAEVRVEVMKTGRTVSAARTVLWQDERPCLDALVTVGELPAADPEHMGVQRPPMPPPEECRVRRQDDIVVELLDHVDVRLVPDTVPFPRERIAGAEPVIRGWMGFHDGADADALALLLAVDVCPPTVFHLGRMGWAPTVELTCLLRREPAPGWLAFEARSSMLAGGWFDEEANVWDSTGTLVAQSRQLALAGKP
ncbi:MAG TPA: thioesterase family protein [Mycobacteriales bacterium]|nr:thioesterase family protein [Mycobacteriales bacterium]